MKSSVPTRRRYVFVYTLFYALLFGAILLLFHLQGRSLVYHSDAWRQHIRALSYYGKWLRGILYNVFAEHTLSIPAWSFGLGYGGDVFTTLQYYCIGEPLTALSVFVPEEYTWILFQALMVVRPYLAGLSFSAYAEYLLKGRYEKDSSPGRFFLPVLSGALCYAFSGTVLYIGMLHPYFVTPMIWLPLLLLGIERVLMEKRPVLLMVITLLAGLSNFYYCYILMLLSALYALFRVFYAISRRSGYHGRILWKSRIQALFRMLVCVLSGLTGAGCILIPIVIQYGNNPRGSTSYEVPLFYELDYYGELLENLVSFINHPQYDVELCVALTAVAALVVLFLTRGHRQLKTAVIGCIIMLCFPVFGWVMNGFSYVIDRWTFGAELLVSLILVLVWCDALEGRRRPAGWLSPLLAVLTVASIAIHLWDAYQPGGFASEFVKEQSSEEYAASAASNEATAAAGLGEDGEFYRYTGRNLTWNAALSTGTSSTQFCWSLANGNISEFFEAIGNRDEQNFAYYALDDRIILNALAGVKYYLLPEWSGDYENTHAMYGYVDLGVVKLEDFLKEEESESAGLAAGSEDAGKNTGEESGGEDAADAGEEGDTSETDSVDSSVAEVEKDSWESSVTSWHVYENAFALPLGYTYTNVMTESEFYSLSMTGRQEALLQSAIISEDAAQELLLQGELDGVDAEELNYYEQEISFNVLCGDGVSVTASGDPLETSGDGDPDAAAVNSGENADLPNAGAADETAEDAASATAEDAATDSSLQTVLTDVVFHVTQAGAQVTLTFEGLENAETYLSITGMSVLGNEYEETLEQYTIQIQGYSGDYEMSDKDLSFHTPSSQYYSGWTDFAVNVGYSSSAKTSIVITFPSAGDYSMEKLQIICQPIEEAMSEVALRLAGALEDADLSLNPISNSTSRITGTVTMDRTRFLLLNIPYSSGWTAYVDGEEVDLQKANIMYMGLSVAAGEHEIRLVYHTPGSLIGDIASLFGIAAMILIAWKSRKGEGGAAVPQLSANVD